MIYVGGLYVLGYLIFVNSLFYIWRWKDFKGFALGIVLLDFSLMSIYAGLFKSGHILHLPFLLGTDSIISSIGQVFIILGLTSYLEPVFKWRRYYWLLFIYPLLQIFFSLPYFALGAREKLEVVQRALETRDHTFFFNSGSFYTQSIFLSFAFLYIYFVFLGKFQWKKVAKKYRAKVGLAAVVWFLFLAFMLFYRFKMFLSRNHPISISSAEYLLYFSTIFLFFQFLQIWPYYFKHGAVYFETKTFKIEKYFSKYLDNVDIEGISTRLESLVRDEEIHKNDNINARDLAGLLGITTHQLSTFLNQNLNQNFSEFINSKRIDEAKKILLNDPRKNITALCYEIGYNNPSVFYRAFKKETGLSPREWLRKNLS